MVAATITLDTSGNWNVAGNWDLNRVPDIATNADDAVVGNGFTVTSANTGNEAETLVVSGVSSAQITITGGDLTIGSTPNTANVLQLANGNNHNGTYLQNGGSVTVNGDFNIATGNNSNGDFDLNSGTLTVNGDINIATVNSADATFNVAGGTLITVSGAINVGTGGNPQNTAVIFNSGTIIADEINVGDSSSLSGPGNFVVNNDLTLEDGAVHDLTFSDGLSINQTSVGMDLYLGTTAGDTWVINIIDNGGLDDITGPSDELTIFSFDDQLFQAGTELTGTGTISNVSFTFDGSVSAAEQDQFDSATIEYDTTAGTVTITNMQAFVPLPNALGLGLAALLIAMLRWRPNRRDDPSLAGRLCQAA